MIKKTKTHKNLADKLILKLKIDKMSILDLRIYISYSFTKQDRSLVWLGGRGLWRTMIFISL